MFQIIKISVIRDLECYSILYNSADNDIDLEYNVSIIALKASITPFPVFAEVM